jgi:hypothetical protein
VVIVSALIACLSSLYAQVTAALWTIVAPDSCARTCTSIPKLQQIEHPGGIGLNGLSSSSSSTGGDTKGISKAKSNRRHKATDAALSSSSGSGSGKGPRYNSSNVPQDALMVRHALISYARHLCKLQ